MDLLEEFADYCCREKLVSEGDSVLLAVSGGPDSLALLDLFDRLREDWNLKLGVFHLDHCLREDASKEAEFVRQQCDKRDINCWLEEVDVKEVKKRRGGSTEEIARELRLSLIYKYLRREEMDRAALGHQANDRAETIIFNLVRGAGMNGLSGISPCSNHWGYPFIRPLLDFTRNQLENYCDSRSLEPRIDRSNFSLDYDRNKIRQKLIPYLENNFNPELVQILNSMAELISEEHEFLNGLAKRCFRQHAEIENEHRIDVEYEPLKDLDRVLRRRLWRLIVEKLLGSTEGFYRDHIEMMEEILRKAGRESKSRDYHLPAGVLVREEYGVLSFRDQVWQKLNESDDYHIRVEEPGEIELPGGDNLRLEIQNLPEDWRDQAENPETAFLDAEAISWPLTIRTRRPGDRFQPLGMSGRKKLKDFFIDEKVPRHRRDKIPLLVDNSGKIIWIVNMRCDHRFRVASATEKILRVDFRKNREE